MKNVRFNCVMAEDTREKLHRMAKQAGRSDSNMVSWLINEAFVSMTADNGTGRKMEREVNV